MKILKQFIILLMVIGSLPYVGVKAESSKSYPMFWSWMGFGSEAEFEKNCQVMKESGIDGVMLGASVDEYKKAIPIARKYGIEVYAWVWTMNNPGEITQKNPDWLSVNRKGESLADHKAYVGYYKFMCPALPEVREHIKNQIRSLCEVEGLNGISIDYHRFVDVILPTTLWSDYGVVQDHEYPEFDYGYHPAMIEKFMSEYGYDPRKQGDPSKDEKWLDFRCNQITEVANEIADVVHSYGKVMAASPFPTPAMSRKMVRQEWNKWNLDIVFPMVYLEFYTGDKSFVSDCTIENVKTRNDQTTLYCGLMASSEPSMLKTMDAALNNGAQGISIFTVGGLNTPESRAAFKAYADSVRVQRAKSTINPAATGITKVNTNPFENTDIMKAVQMRIAAHVSLAKAMGKPELRSTSLETVQKLSKNALKTNKAKDYINSLQKAPGEDAALKPIANALAAEYSDNITLDKFKLAKKFDATEYYTVKELNSKVVFDVKFYFYGGVLMGWSVEPQSKSYNKYIKSVKK